MFGKLSELTNLMKQASQMGKRMQELRDELATRTLEASSGAGLVTVTANGKGDILSVKIDPEMLKPEERETLEELVTAAVNEVTRKTRDMAKEELSKLTGGMDVSGMLGLS